MSSASPRISSPRVAVAGVLVALIATGLTARSLMLGVSDTLTVVSDVLAIALIASFIVVARAAHRARNAEARARVSLAVQDTRLTSIVTNLPGVAYRCRPRGPGFVYVSPAILDLTGIPAVEFMEPTRRFDDLVHPDDLPRVAASIGRAAASGTAYRLQYRLVLADGTLIHVRDTGGVTRDPFDETTWIDGWLFDITEEVDNAERLQAAVAAAEHANRTKSSFLAAMSHELRTPLNAIIGFTKVVRKTGSGTLAARELNYLDRVANNGEHLLGLINDLLDLAKIEAGRMEFRREWVAPAPLLREVIASLEAQALLRGLTLTLEAAAPAGEIELDATRLRQVLINLIGNAIKFTERGGVTVHLEVADGRTCAIHVVDTGIGIAASRLDAIFRPFEQAEAGTARRFGGTGLGLSLSRDMCDHMGCTLSVASVPGEGSTFSIAIPISQTRTASTASAMTTPPPQIALPRVA